MESQWHLMQALLGQASCLVVVCIKSAQPKCTDLSCAFQGGTNAGLRAWGVGEIVSFGAAGKVKQVHVPVHACPQQPIAPLFAAIRSGGTTSVAVFMRAYRLNGSDVMCSMLHLHVAPGLQPE